VICLTTEEIKEYISNLDTKQKLKVFGSLLDDPAVANKAYGFAENIALKCFGKPVDSHEVARDVFSDLDSLDYEALSGHKSRNKYGHVDHAEACVDMFDDRMAPYFEKMGKCMGFGLKDAAKSYCIGIIWGLWQYKDEATSDIRDWYDSMIESYVVDAVSKWRKGEPSEEDIAEVMAAVKAEHYNKD
jgi:hypothetical protein